MNKILYLTSMVRIVHRCNFVTFSFSRRFSHANLENSLLLPEKMPKTQRHIAEVQSQRLKTKEKLAKYVPSRVTLQVLGTGAKGAPRSLYVFSDQSRYLFNCGEGTQRLAHEHKMKLAKLEHIFITQPIWANIGGLPGTALTIQDVGVPEITLHGPQGLEELFRATKRFVVLRDLKIKMANCGADDIFEDNVMIVKYVPLVPTINDANEKIVPENDKEVQIGSCMDTTDASTSTRSSRRRQRCTSSSNDILDHSEDFVDTTDYYAHELSGTRNSPDKISNISQQLLQEIKEQGVCMAYICRLQPRPGPLCLEKCVNYGVPPGPLLGKLKSGQDITLESGKVVCSTDVCEPDDPGPIFMVIDCPGEEYLDSLVNNEAFKPHQLEAKNDVDLATVVVHFTPQKVLQNERYKLWMKRFAPMTQHIILNESNTCMGSIAVHRIQHKLNLLHPEIFPLLNEATSVDNIQSNQNSDGFLCSKRIKIDCKEEPLKENFNTASVNQIINYAGTFCAYHLRPKKGLDRLSELKLNPNEYVKEALKIEGFEEALHELRTEIRQKSSSLSIRTLPKIVFLGTGSCIPNKTRNTSGILLKTSEDCYVIIDCGEGTYGQLVRFYGCEKADDILTRVKAIYISHLHADHHIGLIGLLSGRQRALINQNTSANPVLLFAPKQILTWLSFYDRCFEDIGGEFELIANGELLFNQNKLLEGTKVRILNTLEMRDLNTCHVRHCPNAFGVAFVHKNGYKITYSGDTMPCDSLVELGMNSDLLIHEATMEDELSNEATIKLHSTTSQAIEIGKEMKAKSILLTHFSQRYAKIPRFNDNFRDNVGIAFDNMQVRLDELPLIPLLYPALKVLFAEHYEELEHKAAKRQMKIERRKEASKERQKSQER